MIAHRAKYGPIGLDIGSTGVKMAQFGGDGGEPKLLAAAHEPIPASATDRAERRVAATEAIADALRKHPFRGREVVIALGTREFQMKNIRLPRMPPEEMASAIAFEAQDRFGVDPQSAQFRHVVVGEVRHGNELKEEIIVFAAPNETVEGRLKMMEDLKLRAVAIDIAPYALARSFFRFMRRADDAQTVNVFMEVGWTATSVVLTRGTELTFLKIIEAGGEHLTDAVAKAMSISKQEAAELRVRIMGEARGRRVEDRTAVQPEVRAAVADAQQPVIERISRDVQLCLRYCAVTFRGQRPQSLTVVGGEAHEPTLVQTVGEGIEIPCTIGDPLRGVEGADQSGVRERHAFLPAWAVACGLALRGSRWVQRADQSFGGAAGRPTMAMAP